MFWSKKIRREAAKQEIAKAVLVALIQAEDMRFGKLDEYAEAAVRHANALLDRLELEK